MIEYLKKILSNPDNVTPSAKRHHAFWAFLCSVLVVITAMIIMPMSETIVLGFFYGYLGFSAACLGITSYDYKQYLNTNKPSQESTNTSTNENIPQ